MVLLWSHCSHHACFKSLFRSSGEHDLSLSGRESPVFLSSGTRCRFAPSCLMQELCPPSPIYPPWKGLNNTLLPSIGSYTCQSFHNPAGLPKWSWTRGPYDSRPLLWDALSLDFSSASLYFCIPSQSLSWTNLAPLVTPRKEAKLHSFDHLSCFACILIYVSTPGTKVVILNMEWLIICYWNDSA